MKKTVLVTLADRNYLKPAKQLFSSVYFNAGWQGDYLLLAQDIPQEELQWFRDKGILVKECQPLATGISGIYSNVALSKFYLFTPGFKEWDNVVFLDADIMVRASLDELAEVRGFAAVPDNAYNWGLCSQIYSIAVAKKRGVELEVYLRLLGQINDLHVPHFNGGVLAFSSDIIQEDTFNKLNELFRQYKNIVRCLEQSILNLFFYKKWKKLPFVYNVYVEGGGRPLHLNIRKEKIKGIIIHCFGAKPWLVKNYLSEEWQYNLERADQINLNNIPAGKKWTKRQVAINSFSLAVRSKAIYYYEIVKDFFRKRMPGIYFGLKKIKNKIR